jgi:hypothetical protein
MTLAGNQLDAAQFDLPDGGPVFFFGGCFPRDRTLLLISFHVYPSTRSLGELTLQDVPASLQTLRQFPPTQDP